MMNRIKLKSGKKCVRIAVTLMGIAFFYSSFVIAEETHPCMALGKHARPIIVLHGEDTLDFLLEYRNGTSEVSSFVRHRDELETMYRKLLK